MDAKEDTHMASVTIEEAQAKLADLIHRLHPGEEVVITENVQPIARSIPPTEPCAVPRLGTLQGTVKSMDRFDDPIEDFETYSK